MPAIKIEDLPTVYNAGETEESIYKFWEENECFKADAKSPKKMVSNLCFAYFYSVSNCLSGAFYNRNLSFFLRIQNGFRCAVYRI